MRKSVSCLLLIFSISFIPVSLFAQNWSLLEKTGSLDLESGDYFGYAVATSGNFAVVGAHYQEGEWPHSFQGNVGAAYFYQLINGNWEEIKKVTSPHFELSGYYGSEVAIAGNSALVGAYNEDHSGVANAGRVYAYHFDGNLEEWLLTDSLMLEQPEGGDYFGYTIDMIEDYALVGSYRHPYDENGGNFILEAGAVFLYKRNSDHTWAFLKKLTAPDRAEEDQFGRFLNIHENGMVVGASRKDESPILPEAGSAYAVYCGGGCDFETIISSDLQKLTPSDPGGLEHFGGDVAIYDEWVAIGSVGENEQPGGGTGGVTGTVYFFHWENGSWVERQKAYASDFKAQAAFGGSLSIDGSVCVIGASGESTDENGQHTVFYAGAAYIFELQDNCDWDEVQKIAGTQRVYSDLFGSDVATSGSQIIVGAWQADSIGNSEIVEGGAIYTYMRDEPWEIDPMCVGVAVEGATSTVGIALIQNPSEDGVLRIKNEGEEVFLGQLEVTSMNGQSVFRQSISLYDFWQLDLSHLPSGLYGVSLLRQNGEQHRLKWARL